MRDPEFILLRNRFALAVGICIILLVPLFLFLFNKLNQDDSKTIQEIKKGETFFILVTNQETPASYKKTVKRSGLKYEFLDSNNNSNYNSLLRTLDVPKSDIIPPAILYIQKGQLKSTLNNIEKEEEITEFIENFKGGIE